MGRCIDKYLHVRVLQKAKKGWKSRAVLSHLKNAKLNFTLATNFFSYCKIFTVDDVFSE